MHFGNYLLIALFLSSCATNIVSKVDIQTEPEGAIATLGEQSCITPCFLEKPKGGEYTVSLFKQGFTEKKVDVSKPAWQKNPLVIGAAATIP